MIRTPLEVYMQIEDNWYQIDGAEEAIPAPVIIKDGGLVAVPKWREKNILWTGKQRTFENSPREIKKV